MGYGPAILVKGETDVSKQAEGLTSLGILLVCSPTT